MGILLFLSAGHACKQVAFLFVGFGKFNVKHELRLGQRTPDVHDTVDLGSCFLGCLGAEVNKRNRRQTQSCGEFKACIERVAVKKQTAAPVYGKVFRENVLDCEFVCSAVKTQSTVH